MSEIQFLKTVATHKVTVLRNEGVSRHLVCKRPDSGSYGFQIITERGMLMIWGDCGAYTFERTTDMFNFFRMDRNDFNHRKEVTLNINPGYWSEKVSDGNERCHQYDADMTRKALRDDLLENETFNTDEILESLNFHDGEQLLAMSISDHEDLGYDYLDLIQRPPTHHFLWYLRAIVWTIQQFDALPAEDGKETA